MANFVPLLRGQAHSPIVISAFLNVQLEGHREPHIEVGSLSLVKHIVGLNQEPSDSGNNTSTDWATLRYLWKLYHGLF